MSSPRHVPVRAGTGGRDAGHPLLEACDAREGIVCVVGGGGKKSTMYALARLHAGRVGVTATVHIPPFPRSLPAVTVIEDAASLEARVVQASRGARLVAFACPASKAGRHAGVPADAVARIHAAAGFDLTLVKSDGARRRLLKAPGPAEPCLAAGASVVIPVVSVHAVGQVLGERVAHHAPALSELLGLPLGERIEPRHLARLLTHRQGGLRGTDGLRVVPVVNMVDDDRCRQLACAVAREVLEREPRITHVVLAAMNRVDALVDVIGR